MWLSDLFGVAKPSDSDVIQIWISIFAALTAISTVGLLLTAFFQLRSIRMEARKWESIKACNKFDVDPVIDAASKSVFVASNNGKDYTLPAVQKELHSIITILNALDAIAIGVAQGVYIENVIKDNLQYTIEKAVDSFITPTFPGIEANKLDALIQLRKRWQPKPHKIT